MMKRKNSEIGKRKKKWISFIEKYIDKVFLLKKKKNKKKFPKWISKLNGEVGNECTRQTMSKIPQKIENLTVELLMKMREKQNKKRFTKMCEMRTRLK